MMDSIQKTLLESLMKENTSILCGNTSHSQIFGEWVPEL